MIIRYFNFYTRVVKISFLTEIKIFPLIYISKHHFIITVRRYSTWKAEISRNQFTSDWFVIFILRNTIPAKDFYPERRESKSVSIYDQIKSIEFLSLFHSILFSPFEANWKLESNVGKIVCLYYPFKFKRLHEILRR